MNALRTVATILCVLPTHVLAYEVEIRCGANGRLEGHRFISAPLEQAIASNASSLSNEAVEAICGDVEQCWRQFRSIARASRQTSEILQAAQYEDARRAGDELRAGAVRGALERLKRFLDQCFRAIGGRGGTEQEPTVTLLYPFDGPNSVRTSNRYSVNRIRDIVDLAIRYGVDPYLAIAIMTIENPLLAGTGQRPVTTSLGSGSHPHDYSQRYGAMPVDAIGAYDAMGCRFSRVSAAQVDRNALNEVVRLERAYRRSQEAADNLRKDENFREWQWLSEDIASLRSNVSNLERLMALQPADDEGDRPNGDESDRDEGNEPPRPRRSRRSQFGRALANERANLATLLTQQSEMRGRIGAARVETFERIRRELQQAREQAVSGIERLVRQFPADQRAQMRASINCMANPDRCAGIIGGQDRVPEIQLTGGTRRDSLNERIIRICAGGASIRTGAPPNFVHESTVRDGTPRCCADVRVDIETYSRARIPGPGNPARDSDGASGGFNGGMGGGIGSGPTAGDVSNSKTFGSTASSGEGSMPPPPLSLEALAEELVNEMRRDRADSTQEGLFPVSPRPVETAAFDQLVTHVNGHLGMLHLRNIAQTPVNQGRGLAWALQGYNGRGTMGATERVNNSCLNGINMDRHPVYGAQAADALVNMAMSNPEIQRIVAESSRREGRSVVSVLCLDKRQPGTYQIPATQYLQEQRRHLLEAGDERRRACEGRFRNSQVGN